VASVITDGLTKAQQQSSKFFTFSGITQSHITHPFEALKEKMNP